MDVNGKLGKRPRLNCLHFIHFYYYNYKYYVIVITIIPTLFHYQPCHLEYLVETSTGRRGDSTTTTEEVLERPMDTSFATGIEITLGLRDNTTGILSFYVMLGNLDSDDLIVFWLKM